MKKVNKLLLGACLAIGLVMVIIGISCSTFGNKEGVTEIKDYQYRKKGLKSVIIPEGVTKIGKEAFADNKIETLTLPSTLKEIGDSAFARNKIKNLIIPEGVKEIGARAFFSNEIREITIPEGTWVDSTAFEHNLFNKITIKSSSLSWNNIGKIRPWNWAWFYRENGNRPGVYEFKRMGWSDKTECFFNGKSIGWQSGDNVESLATLAEKSKAEAEKKERLAKNPNAFMMVSWIKNKNTNALTHGTGIIKIGGTSVFPYSFLQESVGLNDAIIYYALDKTSYEFYRMTDWYRIRPGLQTIEVRYKDKDFGDRSIVTTTASGAITLNFEAGKAYRLISTSVGDKIQYSLVETQDLTGLDF